MFSASDWFSNSLADSVHLGRALSAHSTGQRVIPGWIKVIHRLENPTKLTGFGGSLAGFFSFFIHFFSFVECQLSNHSSIKLKK